MQINERTVGDVVILDLIGKMTLSESHEMLKDTVSALVSKGCRKIILNQEKTPYIDSAGLREIVAAYTKLSRLGGKLKLLYPSDRFNDLLEITKLRTLFETYNNEAEAVASFSSRSPTV
ncbi:MAG: STAS domain-containing protein [Candidatus Doudnabacteria bacterium]|nr:STAS domain-containing protein [Candidatus Doudnabacteria bacterium]